VTGKTLIDISAAVNQGAGIGRYARELTRELIPVLPNGLLSLWYAADEAPASLETLASPPWNAVPTTRAPISRANVDRLYTRAGLPIGSLLRSGSPDDAYSPDFTSPPGKREHVTVHDLAWLHPEAKTPSGLSNYLDTAMRRAIDRTSTIFTVSHAIRNEILGSFQVDSSRVVVAPNAASPSFFDARPLSDGQLRQMGLRSPFLLVVGTIEPRKNLPALFEALRFLPSDLSLVVAGKLGWDPERQLEPIEHLGLRDRVVLAGYVPERDLSSLYAAAAAVVYPSRYEGFGLPVVEGLAAGVPVAASDLPVFREVGGQQVEYFDPTDPASIANSIERAVSAGTQDSSVSEHRRAQARKFNWNTSAAIVARRLQEFA
jgi:glycosyltransferase involved in cell wall biosynthesis